MAAVDGGQRIVAARRTCWWLIDHCWGIALSAAALGCWLTVAVYLGAFDAAATVPEFASNALVSGHERPGYITNTIRLWHQIPAVAGSGQFWVVAAVAAGVGALLASIHRSVWLIGFSGIFDL